jgi:hypothetical protein
LVLARRSQTCPDEEVPANLTVPWKDCRRTSKRPPAFR